MISRNTISLDDAKKVAVSASEKARANGWPVAIAIVDVGGHLLYLERADGTQLGSVVVAHEKARTALLFKRPSKVLEDAVLSGKTQMVTLPGATVIEGGLPLIHGGEVVGAIGVSGVLSNQDGEVAAAGAQELARILTTATHTTATHTARRADSQRE